MATAEALAAVLRRQQHLRGPAAGLLLHDAVRAPICICDTHFTATVSISAWDICGSGSAADVAAAQSPLCPPSRQCPFLPASQPCPAPDAGPAPSACLGPRSLEALAWMSTSAVACAGPPTTAAGCGAVATACRLNPP
eukprot:366135-Chlamydomonas_euryale.AAC.6